uniref:Uncharacterized protein n=1 Tax=Glossina austeni TaxID=7395 RepID=A0A1A9VP35_GLOAU
MATKASTNAPDRKIVRDVEEMDNIDKKIADIEFRVSQLTNINKEIEMLISRILNQQSLAIASHLPITETPYQENENLNQAQENLNTHDDLIIVKLCAERYFLLRKVKDFKGTRAKTSGGITQALPAAVSVPDKHTPVQ